MEAVSVWVFLVWVACFAAWVMVAVRFVVRRRVLGLMRSDIGRWWAGPNRVRSLRPLYLLPVVLLVAVVLTLPAPSWVGLALAAASAASAAFALRRWWAGRRWDGEPPRS